MNRSEQEKFVERFKVRQLAQVPAAVEHAASWLIHHLDAEYGPTSIVSSTLANPDRCRRLAALILADMQLGAPVPDLPPDYRPPRKQGK